MLTSTPLLPEWVDQLLGTCEEASTEDRWPLTLIKGEARLVIWKMCDVLGVLSHGVPGQACRLLERYLASQKRIYRRLGSASFEVFKTSIIARLPLSIVSCIQLATKMSSADINISTAVIRARLLCRGLVFEADDIKESENYIYRALGFRIPLWTSLECGEALAVDAGLPLKLLEVVAVVIDTAELCRDVIEISVRWSADLRQSCSLYSRANVRTLHLMAGCVLASARYVSYSGPDPAPRLAEVSRVPLSYIKCISDAVLSHISTLQNGDASSKNSTRKRSRE